MDLNVDGSAGEEGVVYVVGDASLGQLGLDAIALGGSTVVKKLTTVASLRDQAIIDVAAGGDQSFVITVSGRVIAFGNNEHGQLGIGKAGKDEGSRALHQIASLWRLKIKQLACGESHTLAITDRGAVYSWGSGDSGRLGLGDNKGRSSPAAITTFHGDSEAVPISSVVAGHHHSIAITTDDAAYVWGSGLCGQLGLGDSASYNRPIAVKMFAKMRIVAAAAGEYHSIFLNKEGQVFSCGLNGQGQLGVGDFERRESPLYIQGLSDHVVKIVAAGQDFGLAATDRNQLIGWGANHKGQLGLGHNKDSVLPVVISAMDGKHIKQIAAAGHQVHCLVQPEHYIMSWGHNEFYNLSHGDDRDRWIPSIVEGSASLAITQITCGWGHTMYVSAYSASEVQSHRFFERALVPQNQTITPDFCVYTIVGHPRYRSISHCRKFYEKHCRPLIADLICIYDPQNDTRLKQLVGRIVAIVSGLEKTDLVRSIAICVFYEMGGLINNLVQISDEHLHKELATNRTGIVPLGHIRIGSCQHRAVLFKLVCDALDIQCALIRGALQFSPYDDHRFDICSVDPIHVDRHHWNLVKLPENEWYAVDLVRKPAELIWMDQMHVGELMRFHGNTDIF